MRRFSALLYAAAALSLSLSACTSARPVIYSAPSIAAAESRYLAGQTAPTARADRHVIVVSIDGLRPDAIERFEARTLQRLIAEGTYSLDARTITPSLTLPSHTSMLTGAEPEVHGITWNDNRVDEHGTVFVPTMFRTARDHGLVTAAFASKGKFNHLFTPRDLDHFVLPHANGSWSSARTSNEVQRYLRQHRPNLLFVHLREPDHYGHVFGWMGMVYGWAVRRADDALAGVLEAADDAFGRGGYTVLVTADHGGHGRHHGTAEELDMTIPWIAWGEGVAGGGSLTSAIRTVDTAATVLWLLGVPLPKTTAGDPVQEAFEAEYRLAVGAGD